MAPPNWAPALGEYPTPPINGAVMSPYIQGAQDIRWDNPALLTSNTSFNVVGVNIYRSDVSDRGPFVRINDAPVGGSFYRDYTDNILVSKEIIPWDTGWQFKGDAPNNRQWIFWTRYPIVKRVTDGPFQTPTYANSIFDVSVTVDGEPAYIHQVYGEGHRVELVNQWGVEPGTEEYFSPNLPTATSEVAVTYYTSRNFVRSGLDAKITYRLTTVALNEAGTGYIETPLTFAEPLSSVAVEKLNYIWKEAIRRNSWIRDQCGERVKLFIRKMSGVRCFCGRAPEEVTYADQPSQMCTVCYGAGWVGGYEGPYDIIIAPEDGQRAIAQTPQGRKQSLNYEVWTGPSPLVTQRDLIVKQTNERYSIGPVTRPSSRGNILQQSFSIAYLDQQDIRYRVPVPDPAHQTFPQTRYTPKPELWDKGGLDGDPWPVGPTAVNPMVGDKDGVSVDRQQRGRTPAWENETW